MITIKSPLTGYGTTVEQDGVLLKNVATVDFHVGVDTSRITMTFVDDITIEAEPTEVVKISNEHRTWCQAK